MSAYKGQRGPNVSQYIANLNQLSPQQDLLADPAPTEDFSDFLNGEFFDVDNARNPSVDFSSASAFGLDFDTEQTQPLKTDGEFPRNSGTSADANMDFNLNVGDFPFTDFNNFGTTPAFDPSMPLAHSQPTHYPLAPNYASPASSLSPVAQGFDQSSKKRKLDNVAPVMPQSLDENARVAAEEDKRRRNTAASARFRIKKKQREQALEQSQKEAQEKVAKLEATIQQLQTENAWLKGLITEKNGGKSTTDELKALINKREQATSGRSSGTHTDGVGTSIESQKADA
ncbi:regulatory protein cys-3 [Alternaria burnsii]|uniref:Regulatory protein cys-3 n=1 Tax=Alternaria burnsii TaxID=1187904 RepID=A0A8H7BBI4_9PLEO|nr:regulatory protein cys-3 [Alternaria burnsii]KAF7678213.1 regulatory protein cys-3 [Alternaria burnsii]